MTDARNKRLAREVIDCQKDTSVRLLPFEPASNSTSRDSTKQLTLTIFFLQSGITIRSVGESLDHLIGSFPGPGETSYEGGRFEVDIVVPDRVSFLLRAESGVGSRS